MLAMHIQWWAWIHNGIKIIILGDITQNDVLILIIISSGLGGVGKSGL